MTNFLKFFGISDLFGFIGKLINDLSPKTWDSWQALIWFSLFSWAMAAMVVDPGIQIFISTCGWLFLIPGVHWAMYKEKNLKELLTFGGFFIAPWITGALVCVFLFGSLTGKLTEAAFILWAPISATIAAAPKFIKFGPKYGVPDPPVRQDLIILVLVNLLISCWIQLYFATQTWLRQYPSFLAEDFSRSPFVVRLASDDRRVSRGARVLDEAANLFDKEVSGLSWSETERWLLEMNDQMGLIRSEAITQLTEANENELWRIQGRFLPGEYVVQLIATWNGPTKDGVGYYFTKNCQVFKQQTPLERLVPQLRQQNENAIAQVRCGETQGPIAGNPPVPR
jgi:hypothetical protein